MRAFGQIRGRTDGIVAVKIAEIPLADRTSVEHQNIAALQRLCGGRRDHIAVTVRARAACEIAHPIGPFVQQQSLKCAKHLIKGAAHARNL